MDGKSSSTVPVTSGVPQGAVQGPVLFLVYINDLSDYLTHSQLKLFADDSIIYMPIKYQHDWIEYKNTKGQSSTNLPQDYII
jgi:hypothetical protein